MINANRTKPHHSTKTYHRLGLTVSGRNVYYYRYR